MKTKPGSEMNFLVLIIAIIFVLTQISAETRNAIINDVQTGTIETIKSCIDQIKNGEEK